MKIYKLEIATKSSFVTAFQSDTLFGHLCWVVAHQEGEESLKEFLEPFNEGNPPFVFSDGFPNGFLPRPFSAEFGSKNPDDIKKIKKSSWVTIDEFDCIRKGQFFEAKERQSPIVKSTSTHNSIDRLTNTTLPDGGLFNLTEIVTPIVSIYIKVISDEWMKKIVQLFKDLSNAGYGKKKSIGKGQFSVREPSEFSFDSLKEGNGFVTLSNFCPAKNNPTEGLYKTFVKYGRLGEEFTFCGNPFKRPLMMIKTGSVFETNKVPLEYYGRMIEKIAPAKPNVVQYGYAFAVPVRYPDIQEDGTIKWD